MSHEARPAMAGVPCFRRALEYHFAPDAMVRLTHGASQGRSFLTDAIGRLQAYRICGHVCEKSNDVVEGFVALLLTRGHLVV